MAEANAKLMNKALNVFGMGVPDMPKMEKPKDMPLADDKERMAQKEREAQRRRAGKGRAGTILSENSKLG